MKVKDSLGNDSLQTISKRLCECWLLIEQKKNPLYYFAQSANSNFKVIFSEIETLKLTLIIHLMSFLYFLFSDISANWNIPLLQRNTRSAGQTSMPNRPQCTAQVNKTQFIFTIPLIGPNKTYRWMLIYFSF